MPLPQKNYFFVPEVADRWGASTEDIGYFAFDGKIRLCAMVINLHVRIGYYEESEQDGSFFVPTDYTVLNGPQVILPEDIWPLLKDRISTITRFWKPDGGGVIEVDEGVAPLRLSLHQLLITRDERDRFEKQHDLSVTETENKQRILFTHNPTYSEVNMNGERYRFGAAQASVIRELHAAYQRGEMWLNQQSLLEGCAKSTRLVDLFKSQPNWRSLFVFDGRGSCRLNLPEQSPSKTRQRAFRRAVRGIRLVDRNEAVDSA
jgi:hypothetical protein